MRRCGPVTDFIVKRAPLRADAVGLLDRILQRQRDNLLSPFSTDRKPATCRITFVSQIRTRSQNRQAIAMSWKRSDQAASFILPASSAWTDLARWARISANRSSW